MNKQMKKALLLMLASFSILPGCGKKNDQPAVAVASGVGIISGGVALNGNCYTFNGVPYGQSVNVTFQGNVQAMSGWLVGTTQAAAIGLPGVNLTRSNSAGDSLQAYFDGGSNMYIAATLSPTTVAWFQYYNMPLCGLQVYSQYTGFSGGTLSQSLLMLTYGNQSAGISL